MCVCVCVCGRHAGSRQQINVILGRQPKQFVIGFGAQVYIGGDRHAGCPYMYRSCIHVDTSFSVLGSSFSLSWSFAVVHS